MLHFTTADWLIVGIYFGLLFFLALRRKERHESTAEQFLLGGRLLTLPAFIASLVSTWYGGILGVGEFSYRFGISNWVVFGAPYYIFALVFAFWFVPKVRGANIYSIPDALTRSYGRTTGLAGAFLAYGITSPAPYILMLAILIQVVTGLDFPTTLLLGGAISLIYVIAGGFRSVVQTEKLQFALMFSGFVLLFAVLLAQFGTSPFAEPEFPGTLLTLTGGNTWQYILVWFFIALWTLVAPTFHQFTAAAKDIPTARNGILLSILCWMIFDFLTTFCGLYARALIPDLANAAMSYPALADRFLPPIAKGIFYVGMLATVMSTVDGFTFIASQILGKDVLSFLARHEDDARVKRYVRAGMVVTILTSVGAILLFPSIVNLWYVIGTIFIPGLLLPLIGSLWERWRIPPAATLVAMLAGFFVSLACFSWGQLHAVGDQPGYPLGIEPMYPGLAVSCAVYLWYLPRTKR